MIIKMANDQFSQVKIVKVLLVFLAILIVLSLMIIISLPTIKKSIDASGVIPLIKNHISERKEEEKEILLTHYISLFLPQSTQHIAILIHLSWSKMILS